MIEMFLEIFGIFWILIVSKIPKLFFDGKKLEVIRLSFALRNEKFSNRSIKKLQTFTYGKSDLTLSGIPAKYNHYSIIKIRYIIQVMLFT